MQETVKCKDCGHLFNINIWPYKGRIYTCPMCYSNDHIREKDYKKGETMTDNVSGMKQAPCDPTKKFKRYKKLIYCLNDLILDITFLQKHLTDDYEFDVNYSNHYKSMLEKKFNNIIDII